MHNYYIGYFIQIYFSTERDSFLGILKEDLKLKMPAASKSSDYKTSAPKSSAKTPKPSAKAQTPSPKKTSAPKVKVETAEKPSSQPRVTEKKAVYSEKHRETALAEGRFNRVDGQKICGSLLITGAESTWVSKLSSGAKHDELFVYNVDQRIAGKPKEVAEFFSLLMEDKPDRQKLVETVIKNSISFLNYDTTMRTEYEREVGRCQNAKLTLKTKKESKTQSSKLAELESAFVAPKQSSADAKKKSKPEKTKTLTTSTKK